MTIPFSGVQQKIVDSIMKRTISNHLKYYRKKGIKPTVEQVMLDISDKALDTLTTYGYTQDMIKETVISELEKIK